MILQAGEPLVSLVPDKPLLPVATQGKDCGTGRTLSGPVFMAKFKSPPLIRVKHDHAVTEVFQGFADRPDGIPALGNVGVPTEWQAPWVLVNVFLHLSDLRPAVP